MDPQLLEYRRRQQEKAQQETVERSSTAPASSGSDYQKVAERLAQDEGARQTLRRASETEDDEVPHPKVHAPSRDVEYVADGVATRDDTSGDYDLAMRLQAELQEDYMKEEAERKQAIERAARTAQAAPPDRAAPRRPPAAERRSTRNARRRNGESGRRRIPRQPRLSRTSRTRHIGFGPFQMSYTTETGPPASLAASSASRQSTLMDTLLRGLTSTDRGLLGDMRELFGDMVDVDSMSYEDLLELQEGIGDVNRGASSEQIQQLPEHKIPSDSKALGNNCAVCLEPYAAEQTLRTLPCLHYFHRDCIDHWLHIKAECPVCKGGL